MVLPAVLQESTPRPSGDLINADFLIAAGREIVVPFRLRILMRGEVFDLEVVRILRVLPSKRIVGVAMIEGATFLVKVYLGAASRRHADREKHGVGLIRQSGVRTPALRWHASLTGGGDVLGFEYLADAVSLLDRWREAAHEDEKVDVLTRAMVIIGKLHNQGVVQKDIHLANFLLARGRLYTIDGGNIVRQSRPPLAEAKSINNLGQFFAQFFPRYDGLVEIVLPAYEAVREWKVDSERISRVSRRIRKWRVRRERTWVKKAFRDCTRFVCMKSRERFVVCERAWHTPAMVALLDHIDDTMRQDVSTGDDVLRVTTDGCPLLVSRYRPRDWPARIRYALVGTPARVFWKNAARSEYLGIAEARPIAMIEYRRGVLRGTSWLVTESVERRDELLVDRPAFALELEASS